MARTASKQKGIEDPVGAPATRTRKTATGTRKTAAGTAKGKAAASASEFDDIAQLALETKELEDEQRALTGGTSTWVRIIQSGSDITTKGTEAYIKGAEVGDFIIGDKNTVLHDPEVTVLGMFKVYAEKKPSGRDSEMDHTVGFWLPDDAEQIPLVTGSNFKRELGNGNYLIPMHWMFIYIHECPDIKEALVPFQSIGNSYYNEIFKLIKKNSALSTELRLRLSTVGKKNDSFNKTYFYPVVEIIGKNFELDEENGKIIPVKGGLDAEELREVLTRANEAQKNYKELKMVSKRSQQQLIALMPPEHSSGPSTRRGLPGARAAVAYDDEDDEDETPNF